MTCFAEGDFPKCQFRVAIISAKANDLLSLEVEIVAILVVVLSVGVSWVVIQHWLSFFFSPHYLSHIIFLSLSCSQSHSIIVLLSFSFSRCLALTLFLSLSFSHSLSLILFLSFSFSHSLSLIFFLSCSFSHSLLVSLILFLCLSFLCLSSSSFSVLFFSLSLSVSVSSSCIYLSIHQSIYLSIPFNRKSLHYMKLFSRINYVCCDVIVYIDNGLRINLSAM